METLAKAKYLRTSPRKARQVVDLIRGKTAAEALEILSLVNRYAAKLVEKALRSAMANARGGKETKDPESLIVNGAWVDSGPSLKRFMPRARGRATKILKRTSHITIKLKGD